jgi:hypothetical protein
MPRDTTNTLVVVSPPDSFHTGLFRPTQKSALQLTEYGPRASLSAFRLRGRCGAREASARPLPRRRRTGRRGSYGMPRDRGCSEWRAVGACRRYAGHRGNNELRIKRTRGSRPHCGFIVGLAALLRRFACLAAWKDEVVQGQTFARRVFWLAALSLYYWLRGMNGSFAVPMRLEYLRLVWT